MVKRRLLVSNFTSFNNFNETSKPIQGTQGNGNQGKIFPLYNQLLLVKLVSGLVWSNSKLAQLPQKLLFLTHIYIYI